MIETNKPFRQLFSDLFFNCLLHLSLEVPGEAKLYFYHIEEVQIYHNQEILVSSCKYLISSLS